MSDDIDIEEHDVLDNPRIRKIFAGMVDISTIKEEAPDIEDEPMEYEYSPEDYLPPDSEETEAFPVSEVQYPVFNNKIILGSKPAKDHVPNAGENLHIEDNYHNGEAALVFGGKPIHPTAQIPLIEEVRSESEVAREECNSQEGEQEKESLEIEEPQNSVDNEDYSFKPILILGSKPNTNKLDQNAVVLLEDWGPRLENSPCYCKECEILFATRNVLDAHKMTAHSFLVALDESSVVRNTARKSTLNSDSRGKVCHHCNRRFMDDTLLIKHLYEILTSEAAKCDECTAVFDNPADLKAHARTHVKTVSLKPSNSKNVVSLKPSNSKNVVSLKPSNSKNVFHQCFVCGIYIHTKYLTLYRHHMLKNHGITEPSTVLVTYNPHCRFCSSIISASSNLNRHIRVRHTKMFLQKPQKPPKSEKTTAGSKTHKFQCLKCNEVFLHYRSARYHRNEKHPESKGTKLFNKITYRKNAVSVSIKKISAVPKKVAVEPEGLATKPSIPLVPKKVLFKCNQCQVHFTNCAAAIVHSKYCLQYKGSWKCQKCRRSFKMADRKHHLHQHELTDTFDVHTTDPTLCKRVLSKCPRCKLYLHEQHFWLHYQSQCRTKEGFSCLQCKAIIQQSSVEVHKQMHTVDGYTGDEMIWIEYVKVPVETPGIPSEPTVDTENKLKESKTITKTSEKTEYKVTYTYCKTCNSCIIGRRTIQAHLSGKCSKEYVKVYRKICKSCGLMFNHHKKCPIRVGGVKLEDIKFVTLQYQKIINPPIPKYFKCKKCGINGCRSREIEQHDCKDAKKTCKYCKESFTDITYKIHVPLHEYRKAERKKVEKNAAIEMPELLKKYEMLTQSWNLLYSCDACKVSTDTYDKAVAHAQSHYIDQTDVEIKKCQICNLKFDANCFLRHRELHAGNENIHKQSFKFLNYDHKLLLTEDWLGMFKSMPQIQMQLILNNSIYRYTRKIRMEVVKDGAPELTLYKCCKCRKFLVPSNVIKHYTYGACCFNDTGFHCPTCSLTFENEKNCKIHNAIHKCPTKQNYRTVLFNQKDDKRLNEAMRGADSETSEYKHHYYKCKVCGYCVLNKKSVKSHVCFANEKKYCTKCKIYMSRYSWKNHKKTHREYPKFGRKDIKFYAFTPSKSKEDNNLAKDLSEDDSDHTNSDKVKETAKQGGKKKGDSSILKRALEAETEVQAKKKKVNLAKEQMQCFSKDGTHAILMKCVCGLHFTSSVAAETHVRTCKPGNKVSSDNCSKCGRLFDTSELFKHLCKHHSNNKSVTFSVIPVSSIDKEADIDKEDGSDNAKDESDSERHSEDTDPRKMNKKIFNIQRLLKRNAAKYKPIAYKCKCCSIHFMSEIARRMHMKKMALKPFRATGEACEVCGLVFLKTSLGTHKYIHHKMLNLSRKDVIINGDGKKGSLVKNLPKEKCQENSYQITSKIKSEEGSLYRCKGCNIHFMSKSGLYLHVREESAPEAVTCDECDLIICKNASYAHKKYHHDQLNLTRDDMEIFSLSKCKGRFVSVAVSAMDWQRSNVYRCDDCSVYFSAYNLMRLHLDKLVHKEVTKECSFCKLPFPYMDLKRHKTRNHKGPRSTLKHLHVIGTKTLHKCAECPAHFVKKQSLDRHLQKNEHDCATVPCPKCGLTFTKKDLLFHESIHHPTEQIVKDFQIIEKGVNNTDYESDEALSSTQERRQTALPTKIYRNKSNLYKCSQCGSHFMKSESLNTHNHLPKSLKRRKKCPKCGLLFTPRTLACHLIIHHMKAKYKLEDFNIIEDKNRRKYKSRKVDEDSEVSTLENTTSDELDPATDDISNPEPTEDTSSDITTTRIKRGSKIKHISIANIRCVPDGKNTSIKKAILYKCTDCQLHFISKSALAWHLAYTNHSASKNMIHCEDCGLGFTRKSLVHHIDVHHKKNKLSLKDFEFAVYFENPDSNMEDISTVDTASLNIDDNDTESTQSEHFAELNKDTEAGEPDTSVSIDNYSNKLYKCDTCSIHFIDEDKHRVHKQNDIHTELKYDCTKCNLAFELSNIPDHINIHHRKLNLKAEDFDIISEFNESMDVDTADVDTVDTDDSIVSQSTAEASVESTRDKSIQDTRLKLYKCADCDVHFMAQTTCYKHTLKHKRMDPKEYIKCKMCGLQFKIVALNKHILRHHKTESFKIEDVLIEEYHPDVLSNGAPMLNIYPASNKLQSRLISTTTDKDLEDAEANQSDTNNSIVKNS